MHDEYFQLTKSVAIATHSDAVAHTRLENVDCPKHLHLPRHAENQSLCNMSLHGFFTAGPFLNCTELVLMSTVTAQN